MNHNEDNRNEAKNGLVEGHKTMANSRPRWSNPTVTLLSIEKLTMSNTSWGPDGASSTS